jgi:cation transport ATPase
MYSVSLGFMLWTGLPFASSLIATLTQFWPALMTAISLRAERRLFAEHHRQVASARVALGPGRAVRVDIADVAPGAIVWAHKDDYIPVDGIIVNGTAAIDQTILTGARGAVDRAVGDVVYAGSVVRDGAIAVRTERVGSTTSGAALSRVLPQGKLSGLPSLTAVERVANRNAKPALIAAGLLLLATRTPRLSQVAIRPDYATGPRLSTHLSALSAIAESLSGGALIRNAASLDRILHADVCVFDDGAYFTRRAVSVSNVFRDDRSTVKDLVALGASALAGRDDPRGHALQLEAQRLGVSNIRAREHRRVAGAILFRDDSGSLISVSTPEFALRSALAASTRRVDAALRAGAVEVAPPDGRSLVVARDREILGVIAFDRLGPPIVANAVNALRNEIPGVRFVHLSGAPQEDAEARADALGLDAVFGRLNPAAKAEAIRSLGGNVIWIGDGRDRAAMAPRSASAVSVSVAGLQNLPGDAADIALLSGDPGDLVIARRAAKRRLGGMRSDYRVVYFANLAAVAGGFAAGFGSLQAGLASNLGTAAVFLSRWRDLNGLAARTEQAAQARRLVSPGSAGALDDRYDLFPPTPAQSDVRPEQTLRN